MAIVLNRLTTRTFILKAIQTVKTSLLPFSSYEIQLWPSNAEENYVRSYSTNVMFQPTSTLQKKGFFNLNSASHFVLLVKLLLRISSAREARQIENE